MSKRNSSAVARLKQDYIRLKKDPVRLETVQCRPTAGCVSGALHRGGAPALQPAGVALRGQVGHRLLATVHGGTIVVESILIYTQVTGHEHCYQLGLFLGRPGSLPKPLFGSRSVLCLIEFFFFSKKVAMGLDFLSLFFCHSSICFWKVTQCIKEGNKLDL